MNPALSLFPKMSSDLVVAVADRTLWWKIDHGEQPLVHLGCACYSVVAGFVTKFGEYFVEVFGLFDEFTEIFLEICLGFFSSFFNGFFSWLFYRFFISIFSWKFKCFFYGEVET